MAAQDHSDISQEPPVQEPPVQEAVMNQIMLEIGRIEEKLVHAFSIHSNEIRNEITNLRTEFTSMLSSFTAKQGSSHSGPSSRGLLKSRKREVPELEDVEYLDQLVMHEKVQPRVVQVVMMLIVMCFVTEYPQLDSWVPPKMKDTLSAIRSKLGNVSGFSLMYFSKTREDSRTKWEGKVGTLWSWMICSSIATIILSARNVDFKNKQDQVPPWMKSFGDFTSAMHIIEPVVDCLEKHNIVPIAKEGGKRHKNPDSEVSSVLDSDPLRGSRELAIDCIRSVVLGVLTDGRMKSRAVIFKKFLFAMERIEEEGSLELAREAGFTIELNSSRFEEELAPPGVIDRTIWAIPKAQTVGSGAGTAASANHANLKLFKRELENKFKCMNGAVLFRKEVLSRTEDDTEDAPTHPEVNDPNLTMDFRETFNLHRVASTILVDMLGVGNLTSLLSSSALSLRAIHITALALRGMLLKMMSGDLRECEVFALGGISLAVLDKDDCDNVATVAMGKRVEAGKAKKDSAKLKGLRKERRYISWEEYKKEKERRQNIPQVLGTVEGTTNSIGNYGFTVMSPQNVDVSWMDGN